MGIVSIVIIGIIIMTIVYFLTNPVGKINRDNPNVQTSNEYYKMGYEKNLAKDYSGAISDFTKSLELDPNSWGTYNGRGNSKRELKDYYGSIADYTKAIEILNASIDKFKLDHGKEMPDKGIAMINQFLGDNYYNRAISKWHINDFTGACEDAKKSESLGVPFPKMIEETCNRGDDGDYETQPDKTKIDNKDFVFKAVFTAFKENIIDNFNSNKLADQYNIPNSEIEALRISDINYWFDILIARVEADAFASLGTMFPYLADAPNEEKLLKNIQGHFDTYKLKHVNTNHTTRDVYEMMRARVLMYGYIYISTKKHVNKTFTKSFASYLEKEGIYKQTILNEEFQDHIKLILSHTRAALYSAIAFAMHHKISKKDIISWFPEFEEDLKSLKRIDIDWQPELSLKDIAEGMGIDYEDSDNEPVLAHNILFNTSEQKNFNYEETYADKLSSEELDEVWSLENLEKEFYETNDFSLFNERFDSIKNKNEEDVKSLNAYYSDEMLKNYTFVRNLCVYVESKPKGWTFKNNSENRLYDLRYKTPSSTEDIKTHTDLSISSLALSQTAKFFARKLNQFDNLGRKNNFIGYEIIDQIQTRCRLISNYIIEKGKSSINNKSNKDSVSRVNFDDLKDIGIVTHYQGKPFTGIGLILYDSGELSSEVNMLNGLKEGIRKDFDEDGINFKTSFYKKDIIQAYSANISSGVLDWGLANEIELRRLYGNNTDHFKDEVWYFKPELNSDGKLDPIINYSEQELMNLEEDSDEVKYLKLTNYSLMESGLKHFFKEDSNDRWVPGGAIKREGDQDDADYYVDGKLFTGVAYDLHLNGKLSVIVCFNNGKQHGVCKDFDQNGKLDKSYFWIDGEMILPT